MEEHTLMHTLTGHLGHACWLSVGKADSCDFVSTSERRVLGSPGQMANELSRGDMRPDRFLLHGTLSPRVPPVQPHLFTLSLSKRPMSCSQPFGW